MAGLTIKVAALMAAASAAAAAITPADVQQQALTWIGVAVAVAIALVAGYSQVMTQIHNVNNKTDTNSAQLNGAMDARIQATVAAAMLSHERTYHAPAVTSVTSTSLIPSGGSVATTTTGGNTRGGDGGPAGPAVTGGI